MNEFLVDEQRIDLRDGQLLESGSWVYVWMRAGTEDLLYVGATSVPPAARTWLHLFHQDPEIGRVRAQRPDALSGDVTVRAFRLRDGLDRKEVKRALIRLQEGGSAEDSEAARAAASIAALLGQVESERKDDHDDPRPRD